MGSLLLFKLLLGPSAQGGFPASVAFWSFGWRNLRLIRRPGHPYVHQRSPRSAKNGEHNIFCRIGTSLICAATSLSQPWGRGSHLLAQHLYAPQRVSRCRYEKSRQIRPETAGDRQSLQSTLTLLGQRHGVSASGHANRGRWIVRRPPYRLCYIERVSNRGR